MVWSWIDLIRFGCSGNQATILLEALVLMTILVDLTVGSIQLGLVGTREEEASSFEAICRSHKSTEAVGRTNRKQQQCRVYYSIPKSITVNVQPIAHYSAHSLQSVRAG